VTLGLNNTQLSNYKGTNDGGLGSDDNIQIEITKLTITPDTSSERAHMIGYTIMAKETA